MKKCELIIPFNWSIFDDILETVKNNDNIKEYCWALHDIDDNSSFKHYHIGFHTKGDSEWTFDTMLPWFSEFPQIRKNSLYKIKSWKSYPVYLLHKSYKAVISNKSEALAYGGNIDFDKYLIDYEILQSVDKLVDDILDGKLREYHYYSESYKKIKADIIKNRKFSIINEAFGQFYQSCLIGADRVNKRKQLWISGLSGAGKTELGKYVARKLGYKDEDIYIVSSGKHPFDDYKGQPVIIVDDIDSDTMSPKTALKLADMFTNSGICARYHNKAILADIVIFTSTVSPYSWWTTVSNEKTDGNIFQLYRRLNLGYWFVNTDYSIKITKYHKNGEVDRTLDKVLPIDVVEKIKKSIEEEFNEDIDIIFSGDICNEINDIPKDIELV